MKLHSLQVLRAVAAWMVVYHHYMQIFEDLEVGTVFGLIFAGYGNFGVDLFFVLSGFIMVYALAMRERSPREFLADRFFRIAPAYWIATLVFVVLALTIPGFAPDTWAIDPFSIFASLFFIPHINPGGGRVPLLSVGWSLNAEMFFYALIGFAMIATRRKWWLVCLPVLGVLPLILRAADLDLSLFDPRLFWEFMAGILVALVFLRFFTPGLRAAWLAPVLAIWSAFFLLSGGIAVGGQYVTERLIAATLLLISALMLEGTITGRSWARPLVRLGEISYSTYLIHVPVLLLLSLVFESSNSFVGTLVILTVVTVATWAASEVFHRYVEVAPIWARLKGGVLARVPH